MKVKRLRMAYCPQKEAEERDEVQIEQIKDDIGKQIELHVPHIRSSTELRQDLYENYLNKPHLSTFHKLLQEGQKKSEDPPLSNVEDAARQIQDMCM